MGMNNFKTVATTMARIAAAGLICSLAFGAAATSAAATSAAATSAAPVEAPTGLSVTITDGVEEVTAGTDLTYTAELRNTGSEPVAATLVVTVPGYVEITSADGETTDGATTNEAETTATDAAWSLTVDPGAVATVSVGARIGEIPSDELRVTTLVSVYVGDGAGDNAQSSAPIIRSADANTIEGVTDPSTVTATNETDGSDRMPLGAAVMIGAAALVFLALVIVLLLLVVRSKRGGPSDNPRGRRAARD